MPIRALIVIDTGNNFDSAYYSILADTLTAAGIDVEVAFMGSDAQADHENFNFATSVPNLSVYDVIWIFAFQPSTEAVPALQPAEIHALATFMDAGGGVFATGDHEALGSRICGYLPRVRTMRAWFDDLTTGLSPMRPSFPLSWDRIDNGRADTRTPDHQTGSESDNIAQTITLLTSPAHPIFRRIGADITTLPDHMHEGQTLGEDAGLIADDYTHGFSHAVYAGGAALPAGFVEFPSYDQAVRPKVVAQRYIAGGNDLDAKTVNLLSVYDGHKAGVGRVVTSSTFHHFANFNVAGFTEANPDWQDIKAFFVNITTWLARPTPRIQLIVERSTYSEDEVNSNSTFAAAILVTVDGLAPSQFIDGPINTANPSQARLEQWAPQITVAGGMESITITPKAPLFSDDPSFYNRLQRFTFQYDVVFTDPTATFAFGNSPRVVPIQASLQSTTGADVTQVALLQLTRSSNPFMLDSVAGETPHWLSTDLRCFQVTANNTFLGHELTGTADAAGQANQDDAIAYLERVLGTMTSTQFENELSVDQQRSALYQFPKNDDGDNVFNFAIARVRLNPASANASNVRVFFRIFTSQSTALTFLREEDGDGNPMTGSPTGGYLEATNAGGPIAVPGVSANGLSWLSFPFFGERRLNATAPETQTDASNVKSINASNGYAFFGVLLDNNRNQPYLRPNPTDPPGAARQSLMDHLMGAHQCLVAQIRYDDTPIPSNSLPSNSDKLAQRNLAFSGVANPGLNSSRVALHTFEIQATTAPSTNNALPNELLLDWVRPAPEGTLVKIFIPTWDANEVVALADRLYHNHGIEMEGPHIIRVPGNGMRYVPIPRSQAGQTGVISAELPLGIVKGQRFDLAVRQISNESYVRKAPRGTFTHLSEEEVARRYAQFVYEAKMRGDAISDEVVNNEVPRGIFDLNENQRLVTRKAIFDEDGKGGFLIERDAKAVAAARSQSFHWRKTVGGFQLGIPVSVKEDMLNHHIRLLSVFRWRLERLDRSSRWYKTLSYYVDVLAEKVQGLGGNPYGVPITPDADPKKLGIARPAVDPTGDDGDGGGRPDGGAGRGPTNPYFEPGLDDWLGGTKGLPDPKKARPILITGKISGTLYDHFGDFEGFTLEAYDGRHYQFYSREDPILELVEMARVHRRVVTVVTASLDSRQVRRLLLA